MTTSPDRQRFRAVVAQVAEAARAKLPEAVNGRIESAVRLVLVQDVEPQEDGTILVGSSTDPLKTYRLQGETCECSDFAHKAPDGWCQHRIAAGIFKRVGQMLAAEAPPDQTYDRNFETPSLPEAPVSITLKATFDGQEVLVTLRGHDFASVKVQVEEASAWLKAHAPTEPSVPSEGWCGLHHVAMKQTTKDGKSWHSHYDERAGKWCKSK